VGSRKQVQTLVGLAIGAFFLWLVFRRTDWGAVLASIRGIQKGWLLLSLLVLLGSFFSRVQRWSYIVRAGNSATFRSMFSATQIGFLANFTLPGRVGEVVRAVVLSRLARMPFSKCFAMVALDRVTDVIGLIAVLLVSTVAFRPGEDIKLPADIYGKPIPANIIRTGAVGASLFLVVVMGVLVLVYVNQRIVLRAVDRSVSMVSRRLARWAHGLLEQFAQGLHVFRSASDMAKAILLSLVTWALLLVSGACALAAFDFSWPWYAPFMMLGVGAVVNSLPGAPGFVGQFHFAVVVALKLTIPTLDTADAQAVAIVMHLLNLLPIAILGVFCLMWEDFRLVELTRDGVRRQPELESRASNKETGT